MENAFADILISELYSQLRSNGRRLYGIGRRPIDADDGDFCGDEHQVLYPDLYPNGPGVLAQYRDGKISRANLLSRDLDWGATCRSEIATYIDFILRTLAPSVFKARKSPDMKELGVRISNLGKIGPGDIVHKSRASLTDKYRELLHPFATKDVLARSLYNMLCRIQAVTPLDMGGRLVDEPDYTLPEDELDSFLFIASSMARSISEIIEETDSDRRLVFIGESLEGITRQISGAVSVSVSPALRNFIDKLGLNLDISNTFSDSGEARVLARLKVCADETTDLVGITVAGEPGYRISKAIKRATPEEELLIFDNILESIQDCYSILEDVD
jgi:hypothetical protein